MKLAYDLGLFGLGIRFMTEVTRQNQDFVSARPQLMDDITASKFVAANVMRRIIGADDKNSQSFARPFRRIRRAF